MLLFLLPFHNVAAANPISVVSVPPTSFTVELSFWTDCLAGQTDWELTDSNGNLIEEESYSGVSIPFGSGPHNYEFDLQAGCYTFKITDSGNNGMNGSTYPFCWMNGGFTLTFGEVVLAQLEDPAFGSSVSYTFCLEEGCTDPLASNYNPNAISDDGSCQYSAPLAEFNSQVIQSGCGSVQLLFEASTNIATDLNWNVSGAIDTTGNGQSFEITFPEDDSVEVTLNASNEYGSNSSTQTFSFPGGDEGVSLEFVFEPDCWASETGWKLYNPDGLLIAELEPGEYQDEFPENSTVHRTPLCATNGCYTLEITDSYGDGMAGEMYNNCNEDGVFYIEDNFGEQYYLFEGDPEFGSALSENMCLTTYYVWRGTANSNWNNPQNWEGGVVPSANRSLIFDQVNFAPQITQNIAARNVVIRSGSLMDVQDFTVHVRGNIRIDGDLSAQQGTIHLTGNGKQKLISNNHPVLHNLNVDVDTLEVNTPVTLTGRLNIDNGVMDMKHHMLTLVSDEEKTGSIGPLVGNAELKAQKIRIQRYFPAGPAGWRMLCTSVVDATFEQWNDDFVTTGFEGSDYPNYGGAESPWSNIRLYNESVIGEGTDLDNGFESIGSVTDTIDHKRGYFVYMVPAPTMVEVEGDFHRGEISLPVSHTSSGTDPFNDGWNLVANPYPSAISWDAASGWLRDGVFEAIYLFDPINGQYSSYVGGISNGNATGEIASGQAFWVKSSGEEDPQMVINELAKVSGQGVFMRSESMDTETVIHIDLISETTTDRAVIGFNENASMTFDGNLDAFKFFPQNANLPSLCSIAPDSIREKLSINLFPSPTESGYVDLLIKAGAETTFTLRNTLVDAYDNNLCLTLEDRETGQFYVFNQGDELEFEKTEFPLADRFALHFSAPLQVESMNESCPELNDGSAISQGYGEAPWTYQWRNMDGELIEEVVESTTSESISGLSPGFYTLTVINQSELCPVASTSFEVEPASEPTYEAQALAADCNEDFESSILIDLEESYSWYFELQDGNENVLDNLSGVEADFVIDSLSSGTYRIVATHSCSENFSSNTISIRDEDAALANFSTSEDTVLFAEGASIAFYNQSLNFDSQLWSFGDGTVDSLSRDPIHVFAEPGIYNVSLSIQGGACRDSISKRITVLDEVLSTEDLAADENEISVNFTNGMIEVETSKRIAQPVVVEVINSAGQLVISEQLNAPEQTNLINARALVAGLFWVNVKSQGKLLHAERIVKTD